MVTVFQDGAFYYNGRLLPPQDGIQAGLTADAGRARTMAWHILSDHNTSGSMDQLKLRFDAMASHDITYVGIIQTARASGLEEFPIPYVLTTLVSCPTCDM